MRTTKHPFGYEFEVLYPGQRRLFGFDDRLVHEAEREGKFYIIEDFGISADYLEPEFADVMHEQVFIHEFATAEERQQYLDDNYIDERPWLEQRAEVARLGR